MPLNLFWSDNQERLAERMFRQGRERTDPFEEVAVVVGSPILAAWLRQFFLLDLSKEHKPQPVLAGWSFQHLHPFVNDWLAKTCGGTAIGARAAIRHPFSKEVLQWRIWNELLVRKVTAYAILYRYIGRDARAVDRRRWGLAGRLAQLFDDYQNNRPEMLEAWEHNRPWHGTETGDQAWQPVLWRALTAQDPASYPAQFRQALADDRLAASGLGNRFRRLAVFNVTAMPPAYLDFFNAAARFMPVDLFLFNPSREFWIDDPTVRQHLRDVATSGVSIPWIDPPHPLLSGFARGTQAFLAAVLDRTEGASHEEVWGADRGDSLLHRIQTHVRGRAAEAPAFRADDSVQLHRCHSPQREVEIVRDLILRWFDDHPGEQPRSVQVLTPDFGTYAPFIEAVFRIDDPAAPIPAVMGWQPPAGAGAVGAAFLRLLRLNDSRMTAPEVLALLELDPIREACGLGVERLAPLRHLVAEAGIRWGRDQAQAGEALATSAWPGTVTWRRGLDRLLTGFALGREASDNDTPLIDIGALGSVRPVVAVEGDSAELTGLLGYVYDALCETADQLRTPRRVSQWMGLYSAILDRFFHPAEHVFPEINAIRRAIRATAEAAAIADDPVVPPEVAAASIEAQLGVMESGGNCAANAVLFTPLRTMQATPRGLIILMGLNEGVYPRTDNRPGFDWLGRQPRYADRSPRREDRLAFLEALMGARERLILTFTGRSVTDNTPIPPSPAVTEFLQFLGDALQPVEHRLQGFDPAYFQRDARHRAYSRADWDAARILANPEDAPTSRPFVGSSVAPPVSQAKRPGPVPSDAANACRLTLDDLIDCFKNPARWHTINVLQARLDDPARDPLEDSDPLELDTLDNYTVNAFLIDVLLNSGPNPADVLERGVLALQEQALIPLGRLGRVLVRRMLAELEAALNAVVPPFDGPLHDVLRAVNATGRRSVTAEVADCSIAGAIPCVERAGQAYAVFFRYANIKPKDRIGAWLTHLVGHASGLRFTTVIIGKKDSKTKKIPVECFSPLDSAEAGRDRLARVVNLYREAEVRVLPFASASSEAFAKALNKDAADEAKAFEDAAKQWDAYLFAERDDPYLDEAWGAGGPMQDEHFRRVAETFWRPVMEQGGKRA